jgi:parallel beta-helix repeat protein
VLQDRNPPATRSAAPPVLYGRSRYRLADPFVVLAIVLGTLFLAAIVLTVAAKPSRAAGNGLHCGKVVKRSVTLHHDVLGCKFGGLVAGRSGITINLNGHTVGGSGQGVGIRIVGVRGVKVRGGTVRGFEMGVLMGGAHRSKIVGTRIAGSADVGMVVIGSNRNVFRRVRMSGNSDVGIGFLHSHANRVLRLGLGRNGDAGIALESSHRNRIRGVRMRRNGDAGVKLTTSNRNRIRGLRLVGNGDAGILLQSSHRNRIRRNRAYGSSDSGIALMQSSANLVAGNSVTANAEGITVDGGSGNRILHNRSTFNGGAGIEVGAKSHATTVRQNQAHCNLGDGIYLEAVGTSLLRNRATCNGGMGIKAVSSGIHASINWAARNKDDKGCDGVHCTRIQGVVRPCKKPRKE